MFVHVVLLKFTPDTSEEHLEGIVRSLRALPELVPSLVRYRVGRDLRLADDNAQIAVVAEFDDEDGYIAYRDDPNHRLVITEQIQPHLESRSASQFSA
ncbi:MAG TPA: Dabb family protein [Microthrixaceae bacterium]|nr:Dabb family protein [Microthrixaceae bacterium]